MLLICFIKKGVLLIDVDFFLCNEEVNVCIVVVFDVDGVDVWYIDGFKDKVFEGIVDLVDYE